MPDEQVATASRSTTAPRRALPEQALAGLRTAFAEEVRSRLPRLLRLVDGPPGPDSLRDAHALGSSAVVVGELDASRCARALEAELGLDDPDPDRLAELAATLAHHLQAWS